MTANRSFRIVVVEDEDLLRELLIASLGKIPSLTIVGSYKDGTSAVRAADEDKPDVALLDINLGLGWNGVETALQLRKSLPSIGIVLLSNYAHPELLSSLPEWALPGWSYLLKQSVRDLSTLTRAIEGAATNLVVLDPELVKLSQLRRHQATQHLTPRQMQILELVAQGYTNAAISKALFLSEKSVENHLTSIYSALGIDSSNPDHHARVKATLLFMSNGTVRRQSS